MTTYPWGKGRYLKKEVEKAFMLENELFEKTHKYIGKQGQGNGYWKQLKNKHLKDWIKINKANQKYYY